jgi:hypothetical protein
MSRRLDTHTAELVGIAILTRDAFGIDRARRYASLAGLPPDLADSVLSRPFASLRRIDATPVRVDRRRLHDKHITHLQRRRKADLD